MKPMPMEEDDDDFAAISSVMGAENPEEAEAEKPAGDPDMILSELKAKIAELEASLKL